MSKSQQTERRGPQFRTLTPLLRYFVDLELRVELKSGKSYYGFLQEADDDMNLGLTSTSSSSRKDDDIATVNNSNENVFQYSKIHIRGSAIRYIHFPDHADLPALIKLGVDRQRAARDKYARGKRQKR